MTRNLHLPHLSKAYINIFFMKPQESFSIDMQAARAIHEPVNQVLIKYLFMEFSTLRLHIQECYIGNNPDFRSKHGMNKVS